MLLVHRSRRAAKAVRTASPGGELFVASVVVAMLLAAFGDAVDPAWLGEAGLEFALFDFGGELSLLGMHHWHLLQLPSGRRRDRGRHRRLQGQCRPSSSIRCTPRPRRAIDKVPIELRPKSS